MITTTTVITELLPSGVLWGDTVTEVASFLSSPAILGLVSIVIVFAAMPHIAKALISSLR